MSGTLSGTISVNFPDSERQLLEATDFLRRCPAHIEGQEGQLADQGESIRASFVWKESLDSLSNGVSANVTVSVEGEFRVRTTINNSGQIEVCNLVYEEASQ